jgi:uncharacterized SAM-binding protein YcdF (DUF218 family)
MRMHRFKTDHGHRLKTMAALVMALVCVYLCSEWLLAAAGAFLVHEKEPVQAQAAVVLNTGMAYFPRLMEAANLYRRGLVRTVVINGNRKTDELRSLEARGFVPCCTWDEDRRRILSLLGVPRRAIVAISAEDAYDTVSEAEAVGPALLRLNIATVILTTSKSHTRRANHIWQALWGDRLTICPVAARADPFDPDRWWKDARQIRWVLAEYGAWGYYGWKMMKRQLSAG